MRLPIAREGWPIITGGFLAGLFFAFLDYLYPCVPARGAAAACGGFFLFSLYFFRDPERQVPGGDDLVLSPADGTVVDISEVDEPDFFGGRACRVSIFMSPFNVHVNRSPVSGRVAYEKYNPGEFKLAWREKASELNEQNSIGIVAGDMKILVRQIAGWVARRIVSKVVVEQDVRAGERIGMIRFGSRVDLFLPLDRVDLKIENGDKVCGGVTVIGVVR